MALKKNKILICPLNWGLGHGTRDIPIIHWLLARDFHVIIGASGRTLELLKGEFKDLTFIEFPDYNIRYSKFLPAGLSILLQLPKIIIGIIKEQFSLKRIIKEYNIAGIISDNRYGLYSKELPSILITHQVLIKPPLLFSFLEIWIWVISAFWAQKFTHTWIPDFSEKNNLSGDLSHKYPLPENGVFIGPLAAVNSFGELNRCDILILLSGPEPARTQLEKIVLGQLNLVPDLKIVVLLGKPENTSLQIGSSDNHRIFNHLSRKEISSYMNGAELIISRPGYTTVMEVAKLKKKAIWIPTPGQTEQEYLAKHFSAIGIYQSYRQNSFNLAEAWNNKENLNIFKFEDEKTLFENTMNEFTSIIRG